MRNIQHDGEARHPSMSELVNERDTYYLDTADRDLKRILNTPEKVILTQFRAMDARTLEG
jgi:hypothetical protein